MKKYDQSKKSDLDIQKSKSTKIVQTKFLGDPVPDNLNEANFDDIDKNQKKSSGNFSKFTLALKNYIGNKVITEEDLKPVMDKLINLLLEKNVAKEIAENLCENVKKCILNTKTNSSTTIS